MSLTFEDAVVEAAEHPSKEAFAVILKTLSTADESTSADCAGKLELIFESWKSGAPDIGSAAFCIDLAALPIGEQPLFRPILADAVKKTLAPFQRTPPVLKAIGLRGDKLPAADVVMRLKRLLAMKTGQVAWLPEAKRWGTVRSVDYINGTLTLDGYRGVGGALSLPLETALHSIMLFNDGAALAKVVDPRGTVLDAATFRATMTRLSALPCSDAELRDLARSTCASRMSVSEFERYWNTTTPVATAARPAGGRRSCDGRSLQEMELLLAAEAKNDAGTFSDEEAAAFREFFANRLRPETAKRESKLLAEIISHLQNRATPEALREMLQPLSGKAVFWPENPTSASYESLAVWGELSAKALEHLAAATSVVFPEEYLAACATRLPLKALNGAAQIVSDEVLIDTVRDYKGCSADLLLWIWKNRKKRSSEELLSLLNLENVTRVLGAEDLPKAWMAARRELRSLFMDNAEFQKHLIAASGNDAAMFAVTLQGALFLSSGERQSLMVKLSRISDAIRDYLENGAGQRILSAGIGKKEQSQSVFTDPHLTSVKSHKALIAELEDIVNVQVPENREALKTARAHGDFRENSEFDAAKERRNHLSRRRQELERELGSIQPMYMRNVHVSDTAVIGSLVELSDDSGRVERHCLLGAWDGNPERGFLSYRTPLGRAVLNHRVGDKIELSGGRIYRLTAVKPLPEEIITELDG